MLTLPIKRLRELFDYDPDTGLLTWKIALAYRRKVGDVAGCRARDGRILVGIDRRLYKAHRIIWALVTGRWPPHQIDHENEDPSDNRWVNLRRATKSQNMCNISRISSNTSGYKGVGKHRKRWYAKIKHNRVTHHLGTYDTAVEAHAAYVAASSRLHGKFANTGHR